MKQILTEEEILLYKLQNNFNWIILLRDYAIPIEVIDNHFFEINTFVLYYFLLKNAIPKELIIKYYIYLDKHNCFDNATIPVLPESVFEFLIKKNPKYEEKYINAYFLHANVSKKFVKRHLKKIKFCYLYNRPSCLKQKIKKCYKYIDLDYVYETMHCFDDIELIKYIKYFRRKKMKE